MDDGESGFVDFNCKACGAVLCRTDRRSIRLMIDGYLAEITVARLMLTCSDCLTDREWRAVGRRDGRERGGSGWH